MHDRITITVTIDIPPELAHLLGTAGENISTNLEEAQQLPGHDQAEPEQTTTRRGTPGPHPGAVGKTRPGPVGQRRAVILATLRRLHPRAVTCEPLARRLRISPSAVSFHMRKLRDQGLARPNGKQGKSMTWIAVQS